VKRLYLSLCVAVAAGVGVYTAVTSRRLTAAGVFLILTAIALMWVVWILFRAAEALVKEPAADEVAVASGKRKKELEREKQALLKALKELEFDYQMGKVSEADYQEIGGNYRARAVRVLRQLDLNAGETDYKQLVERDLANRLMARGADEKPAAAPEKAAAKTTAKDTEKAVEKSVEKAAEKPARPKCAACSTENDTDAEFCKKCGARLVVSGAERVG
jgi:hypothetical protein